ncbi:unnamed protein product [marine sediment metagenome]|uniref:Uncharacterized protein n=1 Tax=marine sediment metagenome TaxID=412755 RepID=X1GZ41_9ZZZZ
MPTSNQYLREQEARFGDSLGNIHMEFFSTPNVLFLIIFIFKIST